MRSLFVVAALALAVVACNPAPNRPICTATTANVCKSPSGDCTSPDGWPCAACTPYMPQLNLCLLDGVDDTADSDIRGDTNYQCDDCSLCSPPKKGETCVAASPPDGGM